MDNLLIAVIVGFALVVIQLANIASMIGHAVTHLKNLDEKVESISGELRWTGTLTFGGQVLEALRGIEHTLDSSK